MDNLLLDAGALKSTFTAFRNLVEYYVVSNEPQAARTRAQLLQRARGGHSFLPSLYQDLGDICTHCRDADIPTVWDDSAKSDIRGVLLCLSSIIATSDSSELQKLEDVRSITSGWNYQSLREDQRYWLKDNVGLQRLSFSLRRAIIHRSATAAHLLHRSSREYGDEDDTGTKDVWALRMALRLSEPMRSVYETLFRDWMCDCQFNSKHSHVLVSFATPCQNNDSETNCLLKFTTSREKQLPWSTVYLDITDNGNSQCVSGAPSSPVSKPGCDGQREAKGTSLSCLHDKLIQISENCWANARLNFSTINKSWTVNSEPTGDRHRYSMVSLASLMADGATHSLLEKPYPQRLALALIVSYAFLQLGNTPFFPYAKDDISVWFYQMDNTAPILLQPFLEVGLGISGDLVEIQSDKHTLLRMINPDMPCLPVLGKLILELISGRSIELGGIDKFMLEYQDEIPERAPYVLGAVKPCFFDSTFKSGTIYGNENLRTKFLEEVIDRLHTLLSQCNKSLEGEIAKIPPLSGSGSTIAEKRRRNSSADRAMANRLHVSSSRLLNTTTAALGDLELTYCLHDDGLQHPFDKVQADQARYFMRELRRFHDFLPPNDTGLAPVKIAILDTGLQLCTRTWKLFPSTPVQFRSWLANENASTTSKQGDDVDGHGTQCATALLQCMHDTCELYVGQVFGNRNEDASSCLKQTNDAICISQAIRHAVEFWHVDIISMSFGFESAIKEIDDALKFASDHNVLLIAAASNVGGNIGRAQRWPGTRTNVVSMCATEGNGFEYKGNPPPKDKDFNFATLGVMVPVWTVPIEQSHSQQIYRSGTSIATPVAAAIAASMIEFIRRMEDQYVHRHSEHGRSDVRSRLSRAKEEVSQARGMCKVFTMMAQRKGGYDYIHPANMLTKYMTPEKLLDKILDKLEE